MKRNWQSKNATKALMVAARMPRRSHCRDGNFDITRSGVVQWMIAQPEIQQAMFNYYKDRGAIVFDPLTRTWYGVEGEDANPPHTPPDSQESARS